jgi:two-component system cell cycle sensor histidine kinase/response regulator CckA
MPPLPGTETILVVDDEQAVCALTQKMLERYGYRVLCATSGAEALEILRQSPAGSVRLLLVDIVMPEMNGVEFVARARELCGALPFLYVSAFSEMDELRPALSRGLPYIAKPFTSLALTRRIREILDAGA